MPSIGKSQEFEFRDTYRMKKLAAGALMVILISAFSHAQPEPEFENAFSVDYTKFFSLARSEPQALPGLSPKRPWRAGALTLTTNVVVWAFDRYVMNEEWTRINWGTIKSNFNKGFVWDSDHFVTNFFSHPYHGSVYFNSARSSGMGFWESIPYVVGGSLMWELFLENEYPSINDLFITTTAGVMLGETLHRLSLLILDDQARGIERIVRELVGAVLNPAGGVNRLLGGFQQNMDPSLKDKSVGGSLAWGGRGIIKNLGQEDFEMNGAVELSLSYGQRFTDNETRQPFDYFEAEAWFSPDIKGNQFRISEYALLWGWNLYAKGEHRHLFGFFQHYDFVNSRIIELGSSAVNIGLLSRFPLLNDLKLETAFQLGSIMLGASKSEYVLEDERDYNYGWGYTSKFDGALSHTKFGNLSLNYSQFWIHTLVGASGTERLSIATARFNFPVFRKTGLGVEYFFYNRHAKYEKYVNITKELNGFRFLLVSEF